MVAKGALLILSVLMPAVAASELRAACYCGCTTVTGDRCIVSVPEYACRRSGNSVCKHPLEQCTYDCTPHVERPPSCSRGWRCSVRQ